MVGTLLERKGLIRLQSNHQTKMHRAQQRNEHLDSSISSRSMDSGLTSMENPDEALQQRLHEVSRQREQFQQAEVELRAQFIARSEVIRMQNGFDEQSKQHSEIVSNLQGQLQEREQQIRHLEQQLEEKERELHVSQMETNEAVWAKDGLLREQTNELANLRRDRDTAVNEHQAAAAQLDAERTEHMAQLEGLKDQVREKERQLQEIEEQSRSTQEMIVFKDEQLREAQAWMARAQELDAYHVNTNNTLHAELRDRTEQMNQLWVGYQRQLAEVERYHAQMIQRLQQELTDAREQIRVQKGPGTPDHLDVKEGRSTAADSKEGGRSEANDEAGIKGNRILMAVSAGLNRTKNDVMNNGNIEGLLPVLLPRDGIQAKVEHATGLPVIPPPLLGITTVLPPSGPNSVWHHQQAMPPNLQPSPLQVPQPSLAQLQPIAAVLAPQQHLPPLQHQQVLQHHHHPQQHPSPQIHRLSQRPQTQPLQQQQPTSQPQQLQQQSLQSQGHQIRHQELQVQQQQQQQEQAARDQAATQAEQQNVLASQSSTLPPQHQSHNQTQQQQQQQLPSQLLHQQQQSQATLSVVVSEQKDLPSASQQARQEEQQVLRSDLQQQEAVEVQQSPELTVQHRQQTKQQERQVHEQRRRLDSRLQQFTHQQPKQVHGATHQHSQHDNNVETQTQQLQHQQGISSSMGHLGGGAVHSSSMSQEDSTGHLPREVAATSVQMSNADKQELQKSVAQISNQQHFAEANTKTPEPVLLDERSLLACLLRAVPPEPNARIRISSTLPNRLGKMLAPLHWHDYRKQYGRLDEFVGSHAEIFVIEGDFIHLREGAHATFSATTAVAKAAAAAAAATPHGPTRLPTVAVTPVAQSPLQRGRSLKGSNNLQKESKAGPVDTSAQLPSSTQVGNARPSQSPAMNRSAVENGNVNTHHSSVNGVSTAKTGNKREGQHHGQGAGARTNGVSSNHGNENSGAFENGGMNGYGMSGKASGYYGSRQQQGRGPLSGSGQYRKQENQVRPQTQESRRAGSAST
ncbi:unnamed protein product [Calypogeia fissa]